MQATDSDAAPTRLVLTGHSQLMMDGLACLLGRRPDVEVLGHVKDPALLLTKVGELGPDAVLVSLRAHASAPMVVARASRQLREDHPQLGIVVSDRATDSPWSSCVAARPIRRTCSMTTSPTSTPSS